MNKTSDLQQQVLSLPGADHAIELLELVELYCRVGAHKEFTNHRLEFGRVIELADTLFQRSRDADTVFIGSALVGRGGLQMLTCLLYTSDAADE